MIDETGLKGGFDFTAE
ncbi:MAG: hypothetical protein ACREP9_00225, partial [Candidatus Dormibacteraceae bacterium]